MTDGSPKKDMGFAHSVFTVCGIIFLFLLAGFLLVQCFNVLLLILAGILIAVYFRGIALWFSERTRLSEKWSAIIMTAGTLLILAALFWLFGSQIKQQLSTLSQQLPASIDKLKTEIAQYKWGDNLLHFTERGKEEMQNGSVLKTVLGFFKTSFGVLGDVYIILFLGVFFSATPYMYKKEFLLLFPSNIKAKAEEIFDRIGYTLRSWIIGRIISMFAVFILTTIGLWIIGMSVPLALGFIAGIFNFVPNFGPITALIPALLIGAQNGNSTLLLIIIIYTGAQVLESNLITPLIQKKLINISPAFIIIGQVVFGILGGLLGILLATPVLVIIMVLIDSLYLNGSYSRLKIK